MKEKRKKAEIVSQSAKEIIIIVRTLLINDLDNLLSFSSFFLFFTSVSYSSFFSLPCVCVTGCRCLPHFAI